MGKRILLIEDETVISELVTMTLRLAGYEVTAAACVDDGLAALARSRPNLVLLDIMLPGKSGWELLRRVKDDPATRSIPVVVFTAKQQELQHEFIVQADGVISKPYRNAELLGVLAELLAKGEDDRDGKRG